MKFNAEQLTEYLNMEAQYKDMTRVFEQIKPEAMEAALIMLIGEGRAMADEKWVMYRRTSRDGEVMFFVRPRMQWIHNTDGTTDLYKREVMLETDDYDLAEKAMKLAEGD